METKSESKGKATIGYGTADERQIEIVDFVQAEFDDYRLVSVAELEDGTFTMVVENPASTGRAPHQAIRLGKESFMALIFTAHLYCQGKGIDMIKVLEEVSRKGEIQYLYSAGVQKPFPASTKHE